MIFIGSIYQKAYENEILKFSNVGLANADNTLQYNIIGGIEENLNETLKIINVPNIGSYPKLYKKIILKSTGWKHRELSNDTQVGTFNLPILKHIIIYRKLKKTIINELKYGIKHENIIIYSTYLPFLKAIYKLNENYKVTLIVTDLPELYNNAKVNFIKNIFLKLSYKMVYKNISRVDSFVLLTEQMKDPLKVGNRPYVIIEGMVNHQTTIDDKEKDYNCYNKKIILYTGGLHYSYGIKNLLEAFKLISYKDYELWICGSGEAESEIVNLSKNDRRIKFYGYLSKEEVEKLQKQSTILINPRTNDGEYNKYSFPSKTMEYMLTGKPVVMYKLDGIPDEYDEYLYYINGNKAVDIASKIIEICGKSEEERNKVGEKVRKFVMERKNNVVQAEKIMKMILENHNENNC
jgi:glycosyltransferase involved in cell wall biosynthesis